MGGNQYLSYSEYDGGTETDIYYFKFYDIYLTNIFSRSENMISIEFYNYSNYKKRRPITDIKNTSASKMLITTINKMHKFYIWEPIRNLAVISVFISNVSMLFIKSRINILIINGFTFSAKIPPILYSRVPVKLKVKIMAGSKKIMDVPRR